MSAEDLLVLVRDSDTADGVGRDCANENGLFPADARRSAQRQPAVCLALQPVLKCDVGSEQDGTENEVAIGRAAVPPCITGLVGPDQDISVEWDM